VTVTLVALSVFAACSLTEWRIEPLDGDIPRYHDYSQQVRAGRVPYRDFRLEYTPGALVAILAPDLYPTPSELIGATSSKDLPTHTNYATSFALLILVLGAGTIIVTSMSLRMLGASPHHTAGALALLAAAPLVLGPSFSSHYDPWPSFLTACAISAVLFRRLYLGATAIGLGVAAKLYPIVLVPLIAVVGWRRMGSKSGVVVTVIAMGVAFAVFLPFLVISPGGTSWAVRVQAGRGLELESTAASLAAAVTNIALKARALGIDLPAPNTQVTATTTPGISGGELTGWLPSVSAFMASTLTPVALAVVWVSFARGATTGERFVRYVALALTATVVFGRVLSPQYLVWLLPAVPLVRGRRGLIASTLLVLALAVTHVWVADVYDHYAVGLPPGPTLVLLARNALLVALVVVLAASDRPRELPRMPATALGS
jgi:hypothetical protein